jgi:hypothetical protein
MLLCAINTCLYNMILSEETLRYPAAYCCPFHQCIPVQYDIVRRNTKISSSMLLSFSINIYVYNMILSEETLWYPAACYCPSLFIHTCTIWYCQNKHYDIQHHIVGLLHSYIQVMINYTLLPDYYIRISLLVDIYIQNLI